MSPGLGFLSLPLAFPELKLLFFPAFCLQPVADFSSKMILFYLLPPGSLIDKFVFPEALKS